MFVFIVGPFDALSSDVHCPLHLTLNTKSEKCVVFINQSTRAELEQEDISCSIERRVKHLCPLLIDTFISKIVAHDVAEFNKNLIRKERRRCRHQSA